MTTAPPFSATRVVPILRTFSVEKAREFYLDWLGFKVDWEHRFEPDAPLYMQIARDGIVLHLSEHHGDGTPGTYVFVTVTGLDALFAELTVRPYRYLRPGIERTPWGSRELVLIDPFNNKLRLNEYDKAST